MTSKKNRKDISIVYTYSHCIVGDSVPPNPFRFSRFLPEHPLSFSYNIVEHSKFQIYSFHKTSFKRSVNYIDLSPEWPTPWYLHVFSISYVVHHCDQKFTRWNLRWGAVFGSYFWDDKVYHSTEGMVAGSSMVLR